MLIEVMEITLTEHPPPAYLDHHLHIYGGGGGRLQLTELIIPKSRRVEGGGGGGVSGFCQNCYET